MTKLFLYHFPGACSRVTLTALEEAGLEYGDRAIGLLEGEQKSKEYLKIHSGGKVPALSVDGEILTENAEILIFLHEQNPNANLLPRSSTSIGRAKVYADIIWCSSSIHPIIRQIRMPHRLTDGDTSGLKEKGVELFSNAAELINSRLASSTWWFGSDWSILDIYIHWMYSTGEAGGYDLSPFRGIQSHAELVAQRPSYKRALAREQAAADRDRKSVV